MKKVTIKKKGGKKAIILTKPKSPMRNPLKKRKFAKL